MLLFLFLIPAVMFHIAMYPDKKKRKPKLQKMLVKCEITDKYYYVLIGFLAGLGYTEVFLMVTSIYYAGYLVVLIRNCEIKKEFIEICIRKLAEMIVHCGFGFLYVTGYMMNGSSEGAKYSETVS